MADEPTAQTASGKSYGQAAKLGAAIARWKQRAKTSEAKLAKLEEQVTELQKRPTDATVAEENKRLKAEAHARKHDDAFARVAKGLKIADAHLPHVRKLAAIDTKGEPDDDAIKAAIAAVLKDVPQFKGDGDQAETPAAGGAEKKPPAQLPAGEGAARGKGGEGTDGPVVSRKQLKDPLWMTDPANAALAAKAIKAGSLRD
jgi:hypothetical protein